MTARAPRNICVLGLGGVGGYFGGKLALKEQRTPAESQVSFIARGIHLEKIRQDGLRLISNQNTYTCRPFLISESLSAVPGKIELLLLCVKAYDLTRALEQAKDYVGPETVVLPLLNGVDIHQRVRRFFDRGLVLPACVYIGGHIAEPGVVVKQGRARIIAGPDPCCPDYDPAGLQTVFDQAGLNFKWQADPYPAIWEKYVFVAAFALVTAFYGISIGEVLERPEARQLVVALIGEIKGLAKVEGVRLSDHIADEVLAQAASFPAPIRTSYQRDLEAGKPCNEGEIFGGTILGLGEKHGLATPTTDRIYKALQGRQECRQ